MELNRPKYFPALTGLRVILASLVFVYHYSGLGNYNLTLTQIAVVLRYRMTAFFVLSGFVVMYSLLPKGRLSGKEYVKFILLRLLRLLPLYYLVLIVPYFQNGLPPAQVVLTNITLTKGFFKELFLSGIGPDWSLTTEITFYFFVPLIHTFIYSGKKFSYTYLLVILTGLLLTIIGNYLLHTGYTSYGFFADFYFTLGITFFGRATDFFVGMFLASLIYSSNIKYFKHSFTGSPTYLGLFLIILISYLVYFFENLSLSAGPILALICLHLILPFAVGYFLWGLITEKTSLNKFLSLKWMVVLGNGAYGFYLMHAGWVQFKIQKINFLPDNGFVLLWITAVLTYYLFEKPIIYFFKGKIIS